MRPKVLETLVERVFCSPRGSEVHLGIFGQFQRCVCNSRQGFEADSINT